MKKRAKSFNIAQEFSLLHHKLEQLLQLRASVVEMGDIVKHMSDKFDEAMKRFDCQDAHIKALKKRVDKIESSRLIDMQKQLQEAVHDLEWRSRQLNLEFDGIPVTTNENPLEKINELFPLLEFPNIMPSDIRAIHRLPAKLQPIHGIIVRYNRLDVLIGLKSEKRYRKKRRAFSFKKT